MRLPDGAGGGGPAQQLRGEQAEDEADRPDETKDTFLLDTQPGVRLARPPAAQQVRSELDLDLPECVGWLVPRAGEADGGEAAAGPLPPRPQPALQAVGGDSVTRLASPLLTALVA